MKNSHRRGFTLIEIMLVVAIIAILVAIAIPALLRTRLNSNESAAISNLRAIVGAQVSYRTSHNEFATTFEDLTSDMPPYLNGQWDEPRFGYNYVLGGTSDAFTVNANAVEYGTTGNRGFFSDSSGIVRVEQMSDATAASSILGENVS